MDQLRSDLDNGDMSLDQRLTDMGLDPQEYKKYGIIGYMYIDGRD